MRRAYAKNSLTSGFESSCSARFAERSSASMYLMNRGLSETKSQTRSWGLLLRSKVSRCTGHRSLMLRIHAEQMLNCGRYDPVSGSMIRYQDWSLIIRPVQDLVPSEGRVTSETRSRRSSFFFRVCIHARRVHGSLMAQRTGSVRDLLTGLRIRRSRNFDLRICLTQEGQISRWSSPSIVCQSWYPATGIDLGQGASVRPVFGDDDRLEFGEPSSSVCSRVKAVSWSTLTRAWEGNSTGVSAKATVRLRVILVDAAWLRSRDRDLSADFRGAVLGCGLDSPVEWSSVGNCARPLEEEPDGGSEDQAPGG